MDMILQDNKMQFGYYMVTPDKNGLYAYAKVRSNGISIFIDRYSQHFSNESSSAWKLFLGRMEL